MKRIIAAGLTLILFFALSASAASEKPIIKADTTYYDNNTGLYVLKGNVYIEVNHRITTAGQARVSPGTMEIWGAGGVSLVQDDIEVKADSVHVISSASRAIIEGNVVFRRPGLSIEADKVEFNWSTRLSQFTGNVRVNQNGKSWAADSVTYNIDANTLQ